MADKEKDIFDKNRDAIDRAEKRGDVGGPSRGDVSRDNDGKAVGAREAHDRMLRDTKDD